MTHTDDHRPVRTLVEQLTNQDAEIRQGAISELEELLSERPGYVAWGREAILTRLEDPDPTVRATACRIIAALGIKEARSQLDDLRLDPDATVSNVASEALPRLREADRVEPVEPPAETGSPNTTTDSSQEATQHDQAAAESTGTHDTRSAGQQPNSRTTAEKTAQGSRRQGEANTQQPSHQQPTHQSSHQQSSQNRTTQQSTRTTARHDDTRNVRQQQTQPTRNAETHDETASGQADGMGGKALAVTVGYGLLGLFFSILPVFLMGTFPPDASMGVGSMMAGYMTLAGGIVVLVAAALKGSGKPAETTRGVAIFGSLLAIVGTVLIFIT